MPRFHLSRLPKGEQQELLSDLNYLNLSEIKSLCKRHSIPYRIAIETDDGRKKPAREDDRKGVILARLRHFLRTGFVRGQTCFPARVVCSDPLPVRLTEDDRLFYGQYDKTNRAMTALLKRLTGGRFRHGAIARMLARKFWSEGEAPTFGEFAAAWVRASARHTRPNPEWAFLSDKASMGAMRSWKKIRAQKASKVLKVLNRLSSG
jgi:hypothetical protein